MSINRVYVNSNLRQNLNSTYPSNFVLELSDSINLQNINGITMSHITIENLPYHPTFKPSNASFRMLVGISEYSWTMDTRKILENPTELINELNAYYQVASSSSDEPFSFSDTTKRITISLTSEYTIYPDDENSGFKKLGFVKNVDYEEGQAIGLDYVITFASSPNLSRSSVCYIRADFIDDTIGANDSQRQVLASIPLNGTGFGSILNYAPTQDFNYSNSSSNLNQLRFSLLDSDFEEYVLQHNALVNIELQLNYDLTDVNGDGIADQLQSGETTQIRGFHY